MGEGFYYQFLRDGDAQSVSHEGHDQGVIPEAVRDLRADGTSGQQVLTFGFTLLTSDIAIGRRTQESAIRAYAKMRPKWKFLGVLTFLVPVLIMTYYAVIGWGMTPDYVIGEMERNGENFRCKKLYRVMIRYVAPVMMLVLFLQSTGILS